MEDFYVVLPSNVKNVSGKLNKTGHFTTYLPTHIVIDKSQWKVALVDISCSVTWRNVDDGNSAITVRKDVTNADLHDVTVPMEEGYYDNILALTKAVSFTSRRAGFKGDINVTPDRRRVEIKVESGTSLKMHPTVSHMLGFIHNHKFDASSEDRTYLAEHFGNVHRDLDNIYLYTNIVEPIIVGDTYAPLLQTIPVDPKMHGQIMQHQVMNPQYMKLETGNIAVIEIKLCDDRGRTITFDRGTVIVKLHFKKFETWGE